jgi:hypothetical protein
MTPAAPVMCIGRRAGFNVKSRTEATGQRSNRKTLFAAIRAYFKDNPGTD